MSEPVEVWFNPSCSTCRIAREQLEEAGGEYRLRRYLDDPPTEAELRTALAALGLEPWDITRMSEPPARELGLRNLRPMVLTDDGRARVARDDETLTEVVAAARRPDDER